MIKIIVNILIVGFLIVLNLPGIAGVIDTWSWLFTGKCITNVPWNETRVFLVLFWSSIMALPTTMIYWWMVE